MDTFEPAKYGPQPSQRIATMVVYLSEVEEGGQTMFKREGLDGKTMYVSSGWWQLAARDAVMSRTCGMPSCSLS